MTNPAPLMNCEQLAHRLGVTVRFVRRLVDERRVPFLKVGKFVRFDPEHIERWLSDGADSAAHGAGREYRHRRPRRPR